MDDDDPEACAVFLEFLYTTEVELLHTTADEGCNFKFNHVGTEETTIDIVIRVCRMADKYDVQILFGWFMSFFESDPRFYKDAQKQSLALLQILAGTERLHRSERLSSMQDVLIKNLVNMDLEEQYLSASSMDILEANGHLLGRILFDMYKELKSRAAW